MTTLGILADDLTGACDTALAFFQYGYSATVVLSETGLPAIHTDTIAFTTHSRHCAPHEAYKRTTIALEQLRGANIHNLYKKIDSALRGNIGSELDALCDGWNVEVVLIAPTLPAARRIVENGRLQIDGQPLAANVLSRVENAGTSGVAEIIAQSTQARIHSIPLQTIRAGEYAIEKQIHQVRAGGTKIFVLDAVTDQDLTIIARLLGRNPKWQAVGSAGLAAAIARSNERSRPMVKPQIVPRPRSALLAIVGSLHPMARAQLEWLQAKCAMPILRLESSRPDHITQLAHKLARQLAAGQAVALTTLDAPLTDNVSARAMERALGKVMTRFRLQLDGMVISGGETAMAVLSALGVQAAELIGQVEPGVPALRLHGGALPNLPIVTKAGSFGNPETLATALAYLRNNSL